MLRGLLDKSVPFTQGAQPDGSNPQGNKWPNLAHTSQTLGEVKGQRGLWVQGSLPGAQQVQKDGSRHTQRVV